MKFGFSLLVAVMMLFGNVGSVQAAPDLSALVARMQEIINEMQTLQAEFAEISSQVAGSNTTGTAAPTGAVLGAATTALQEEAVYGNTNDTITKIQTLLATDPLIYADGTVSGFYGPKTEAALKNLQSRFGMDPVGVVGPSTAALLLEYFTMYPDGDYPANVLKGRPSVATTNSATPTVAGVTTQASTVSNNRLDELEIKERDDEYYITIQFTDGSSKLVIASDDDEDTIVNAVVRRTDLTAAEVRARLDVDAIDTDSRSSARNDVDKDDAKDALDEAEDALEDAEAEIDEAKDDDEETEYAEDLLDDAEDLLEEAEEAYDDKDYDEALEKAEEAEDKAEEAEDAIGEDLGDAIRDIVAVIAGESAEIEVTFDNGDDESFTVDETDENDIIEAVADRLDISENDVEDEINFELADIDEIEVETSNGVSYAKVRFEDGSTRSYTVFGTEEDDLIEKLADRLDIDEDDIEDIISFE